MISVRDAQADGISLVGGGGHALVVCEAARLAGHTIHGYYDDNSSDCLLALATRHLGGFSHIPPVARYDSHLNPSAILAVGDLALRQRLLKQIELPFASIVHPKSIVSPGASVGEGSFVAASAVVSANAGIGRHAIVNTRAIVEHDCVLQDNVHVGPAAVLGGGVRVGANSLIGLNACVKPNVAIGRNCIIGAGAVVVNDVRDDAIVVGVPARPIARREFERLSA